VLLVVADPGPDRDRQGVKPMFRRRHGSRDVFVNRFSQTAGSAREMRELAHAAGPSGVKSL
jgi:hypothetical protein